LRLWRRVFRSPLLDEEILEAARPEADYSAVAWSQGDRVAAVVCVATAPAMLLEMVASLRKSRPGTLIVIVLQGQDLRDRFLEMVPGDGLTRWVMLNENVGEPKGLNIGLLVALELGADLLLSCNFDIVFFEDAVSKMVDGWKRAKNPGLLGPLTNLCWTNCGQVQHDPSFRLPKDIKVETPEGKKMVRRLSWVPYANGFCVMTSRVVLNRIGFYDEGFPPYAGLDDDLCIRAKLAGYRLYIDRAAFVYHKGGGSKGAVAVNRNLAKQKAFERLANKYGVQNRELLYHALEIDKQTRDGITRFMAATLPVLEDVSDIAGYAAGSLAYSADGPGSGGNAGA